MRKSRLEEQATGLLEGSPLSALVYTEVLLALDPQRETCLYLHALALSRTGHPQHALWLLRQPAILLPHRDVPALGLGKKGRPAIEVSLRCARLYAAECLKLGRAKEGRDALARILQQPIPPDQPQAIASSSNFVANAWVCDLELARLALAGHEIERAIVSFKRALSANPACWEAFDALCSLGHVPDVDSLYHSTGSITASPITSRSPVSVLHQATSKSSLFDDITPDDPLAYVPPSLFTPSPNFPQLNQITPINQANGINTHGINGVKRTRTAATTTLEFGRSTRRSSRLLKEQTNKPTNPRLQTRDKKRTRNGFGPSVLSDPASPPHSTPSPAISPDPPSFDSEENVQMIFRFLALARAALASHDSAKVVSNLNILPPEILRTHSVQLMLGKAHLESLNYDQAEKAFSNARTLAPHSIKSMELYSTVLWHLRCPTKLSFLAQEVMTIAPRSSTAWICSGNVFSHLEDHASALRCFKRAAQLDAHCVYAYTLAGHECIQLEEWERALGLFREALRRNSRHYNAWFGIGNAYMQTGKYRLAEYHFRKAMEINPSNATLVCCVGSVLEKLGRKRDALEMYEKACLLAPHSPAVKFKRVKMLIQFGQLNNAEAELLTLKDRVPNEFNVHFLLGKLYKLMDRPNEMTRHFALAQDLEPRTGPLIREVMGREEELMDIDESRSD